MPKDFLNAVGSFGEGFLKAIQSERERLKEEQQFKQRMAFENRQLDLMDSWKKLEYNYKQEKDRYDAEGDNTNLGSDLSKIAPNLQRNVFKGSDYPFIYGKDNPNYYIPNNEIPKQGQAKVEETKDPRVGDDGYIYRWSEVEKKYIKTNLKAPEKDVKNPTNPTFPNVKPPTQPDLSNEIDDVTYWEREYKSKNDEASLQNLESKTESLVSKAKLMSERDMLWNAYKSGLDYNSTIEAINNYRVQNNLPELTDWQIDVLRRYYNARVPKAYK